jgi:mono/diheme cytochrome c family protein
MSILDVASAVVMGVVVVGAIQKAPPLSKSIDEPAARQGQALFEGPAKCATCHAPKASDEGWDLHSGAEIGIGNRATYYRAEPLRGLLDKQRNGLYHDHRFLTLDSVVKHYDAYLKLNLSAEQKRQLVEYLKTL